MDSLSSSTRPFEFESDIIVTHTKTLFNFISDITLYLIFYYIHTYIL